MNPQPILIGIDEAGRGPWAGPLCAAAVALAPNESTPPNTKDSKKIPESEREKLALAITASLRHAIVTIPVEEIDLHGVHKANKKAFETALQNLLEKYPEISESPYRILIDGNPYKGILIPNAEFFRKGEDKFPAIAAASILAKTHRDQILRTLSKTHPTYGFASHKGYGTKTHQLALQTHGPLPGIHRTSFAPIARFLAEV